MKQIIFTLLAAAFIAGATTTRTNAQTISNAFYVDSCNSGFASPTSVFVSSANAGTCLLETNYGDGFKDTAAISGGYTFLSHQYAVTGTYTLKHVLLCGGSRMDSLSKSYYVSCSIISGRLYNDINANCSYGTGEPLIYGGVQIQVDSAGKIIDTINAWGNWAYTIKATSSTVYKFTIIGNIPGYAKSCPVSGTITYTYNPSVTAIPQQDFGFTCNTPASYDYKLSWIRSFVAPGSPRLSYIWLLASNATCSPGTGTVTLNVSPKYNITTAAITPTPTSVSGNTITWTLANMASGAVKYLHVPLTPKSTTSLGDTACNYAVISPTSDLVPSNNIINRCDTVSNSWDPNEKTVSPSGYINNTGTLTYTVDFENLGNDTAFNVHVQDTLSQYLDAGSFALVGSSHPVTPSVYQTAAGNIIKFDFANIMLPGKNSPMYNKGQVIFSIKVKGLVPFGTFIPNRAGIYFDGNPVVLTNYAVNQTAIPTAVPATGTISAVKVFPNPAGNALTVQVSGYGYDHVVLRNALGQAVLEQSITRGDNTLHIERLPAGIYYLQAKGSAGSLTQKIEKQ